MHVPYALFGLGDRITPGNWRVEKMDEDGGYEEVKVFTGPDARWQAIRYAADKYDVFDVIRLGPYGDEPTDGLNP